MKKGLLLNNQYIQTIFIIGFYLLGLLLLIKINNHVIHINYENEFISGLFGSFGGFITILVLFAIFIATISAIVSVLEIFQRKK